MKKVLFLLFYIIFGNLKAQLYSVGGIYQLRNSNAAQNGFGIDLSRSTSKYELSAGFLSFNQSNISENNLFLKADYHIWNYHHAYGFKVKRWTPFFGITINHRSNSEVFKDTTVQNASAQLRLRTGVKVSFCSFIFATDYQFGNGGYWTTKLCYVLFVGNKCSKKYIRECNPVDWSQF